MRFTLVAVGPEVEDVKVAEEGVVKGELEDAIVEFGVSDGVDETVEEASIETPVDAGGTD